MKKFFTLIGALVLFVSSLSAATNICGTIQADANRMYQFVKSQNSSFDREIAEQFIAVGKIYGIRGDIALCQSIVETGWFKYTGGTAVTPDDHNYCGLGVTVLGEKGCQFDTVKEGVTAQIQHLYAYATTSALPAGETLIDPRFNYVSRGSATTWEGLDGKWAMSSGYGSKILSVYDEMMSFAVTDPTPTTPALTLTEGWNYSETKGTLTQNGWDASKVRNMTYSNGKLYLIYNTSSIKVVNSQTGASLGDLDLTNVSGGTLTLCDVAPANGGVIACNLAGNTSTALKVYYWSSDNQQPKLILETTQLGGASRVGDCMRFYGTMTSGKIVFGHDDNTTARIIEYSVTNGNVSTSPKIINVTTDGSTRLNVGASMRVMPESNGYWVDGKNCLPTFVNTSGVKQHALAGESVTWGNAFDAFSYDSKQYALVATYTAPDGTTAGNYIGGRMRMYDCSNGWASASAMTDYPSAGLGSTTRNTNCAGSIVSRVGSDYIEAWICSAGQGIAYYKTGNVPTVNPPVVTPPSTGGGDNNETPSYTLDDNVSSMTQVWNYSANTSASSWLSLADAKTRHIAYHDGKLYVLNSTAWQTPVINIVDAYTGVASGTVNLDGVSGGLLSLSSLRIVDGKLVASNTAKTTDSFIVYCWKNGVSSAPTVILTDATHGSVDMGSNIAISGNLTNGRIWTTDAGCNKVLYYTISNGVVNTTPTAISLKNSSGVAISLAGARGAAEVIPNTDGTFWVDGQSAYPTLFDASGKQIGVMQAGALNSNTRGTAIKFFDYGTKKYAAAVAYEGSTQNNGYFTLIDVTGGAVNATGFKCKYPSAGLGSTANDQHMSAICQSTRDNGYILDIWVCCYGQGVAYYTYNGKREVGVEGITCDEISAQEMTVAVTGSTVQIMGIDAEMIQLYSMSGACVGAINNSNDLEVDGLNGIYVIVVKDTESVMHTQKIIIR